MARAVVAVGRTLFRVQGGMAIHALLTLWIDEALACLAPGSPFQCVVGQTPIFEAVHQIHALKGDLKLIAADHFPQQDRGIGG